MNEADRYPRNRWFVLLAACLGTAAFQISMIAYAPLLSEIAKSLGVDMGAATNLMTAFVLSASVMLILGGGLCDRYGVKAVIVLGLLCVSVPAAAMPWIGVKYPVVFCARLVQGASVGLVLATWAPLIAVWFPPEKKGLVAGLIMGAISLGSAIGVLVSPVVFLAVGSWQKTAALLSIPGWLTLVFTLFLKGRPQDSQVPSLADGASITDGALFRKALFAPITWVGILIAFFTQWCLQSVYNLVPAYLAADVPMGVGFGPMLSGQLSLAIMISGMFAPVLGGLLQDKVVRGDSRLLVIFGFLLTGAFTYLILFSFVHTKMLLLSVCLILAGGGVVLMNPAMAAFVTVAYPIQIVGRMNGLWLGVGAFGGVAGLYAGGRAVAKSGNFTMVFIMVALAAVAGFVCALFMTRPSNSPPADQHP